MDGLLTWLLVDQPHFEAIKRVLEIVALVATVIAIPWVSSRFLMDLRARQRERAAKIYREIDQVYQGHLQTALQHPRLDAGPYPYPGEPPALSEEEKAQQAILFDVITSGFEICYLTFLDYRGDRQFQRQWQAWRRYITAYCEKPAYRSWMQLNGLDREGEGAPLYDPRFDRLMGEIYRETAPK